MQPRAVCGQSADKGPTNCEPLSLKVWKCPTYAHIKHIRAHPHVRTRTHAHTNAQTRTPTCMCIALACETVSRHDTHPLRAQHDV